MDLLSGIVDDKVLRVIRLFMDSPDAPFHIAAVSEKTGVPLSTAFRIVHKLSEQGIIKHTQISKFRIYSLARNKRTKALRGMVR